MGQRDDITKIFSGFRKRIYEDQLLALRNTIHNLVDQINVPIKTHNLWDSIGCGIYYNGSLVEVYFPVKEAKIPNGGKWGRDELESFVVDNPPGEILSIKGWALYYVASMPYAESVDDREDVDVLLEDQVVPTFLNYYRP